MTTENEDPRALPLTDLPTVEDTQEALDIVDHHRKRAAAVAIKELACRIIEAVREVDAHFDVAKYLNSITLVIEGTGSFRLNMDDRDTGVSAEEIMEQVGDMLAHDYHKPPRDIQIGDDNDSAEPTPDAGPYRGSRWSADPNG